MCRVGPTFEEPLDDDKATVLTDGVDDIYEGEVDDTTTGAIQWAIALIVILCVGSGFVIDKIMVYNS
ncbi:hypothetical protein HAX54_022365 [Datura stramonium]|uniref:Uncharacterized protein n=1 Tax=Datura stramonium TaxID=4076 RepID=A0ABS8UW12_DATST|nr:hypothetical protein [Datura stramonium]